SASALSLDAQPAQAERVVRRISRPVCGMGIDSLPKRGDRQRRSPHDNRLRNGWLCVWQWQNKLLVAGDENRFNARRETQNVLISDQRRRERLRQKGVRFCLRLSLDQTCLSRALRCDHGGIRLSLCHLTGLL